MRKNLQHIKIEKLEVRSEKLEGKTQHPIPSTQHLNTLMV